MPDLLDNYQTAAEVVTLLVYAVVVVAVLACAAFGLRSVLGKNSDGSPEENTGRHDGD